MKIISNFKDYYDSVAYAYGGGDPKIVYVRRDLADNTQTTFVKKSELKMTSLFDYRTWAQRSAGPLTDSIPTYLCIAGKSFLLLTKLGSHEPLFYRSVDGAEQYVNDRYAAHRWYAHDLVVDDMFNGKKEHPELVAICQALKQPVFQYTIRVADDGKRQFVVFNKIPNLSKMGIAKFYPPEMLYQDLSYFMGNTINGSPDIDPPVLVSNKDRIIQHGFDIKTSFRGKR